MSKKLRSTQPYNITQVERVARLPRRTIHFYVKEGLIPPPEGLGRNARYTDDHVLRLELIRHLKSSTHLRLEGIREIVEPLTTTELREHLKAVEAGVPTTTVPPKTVRVPQKVDYFVVPTTPPEETLDLSAFAEAGPDPEDYLAATSLPDGDLEAADTEIPTYKDRPLPADVHRADTWTRVYLTNDLELHYRPQGDDRFFERLRRLITIARKMFAK